MKKLIISLFVIFSLFNIVIKVKATSSNQYEYPNQSNVYKYPECYQQTDSRWADYTLGGAGLGPNGCGILSLVNAVNYVTGNFMDPREVADYAYSLNAYNGTFGGGTMRDMFYPYLEDFEAKYGFKVVKASTYGKVTDKQFIDHLLKGGVSVSHVYGHFIAIVAYDEENESYLVYDSAASVSRRATYDYGTWLTKDELTGSLYYMDVDWYALIEKTTEKRVIIDEMPHSMLNNTPEIYLNLDNQTSKLISGKCLESRGIINYFALVNYDTLIDVNSVYKEINDDAFSNCNPYTSGFSLNISPFLFSSNNTYFINIYANTLNDGVITVCKVIVKYNDKNTLIDNKEIIYFDGYRFDKGVIKEDDNYYFSGNPTYSLNIGTIDLSRYTGMKIKYHSLYGSNAVNQDLITLSKSRNRDVNNIPTDLILKKEFTQVQGFNEINISFDNLDYFGNVYFKVYSSSLNITSLEFCLKENEKLNDVLVDNPLYQMTKEEGLSSYLDFSNYPLAQVMVKFNENVSGGFYLYNRHHQVISYATSLNNCLVFNTPNYDTLDGLYVDTNSNYEITLISNKYNDYNPYYKLELNQDYHYVITSYEVIEGMLIPSYTKFEHFKVTKEIPSTCTESGEIIHYCAICNQDYASKETTNALGHRYYDYTFNDDGHYIECLRCGLKYNHEKHTYDGYISNSKFHYQQCICGYKTNTVAHISDGYKCDDTSHYQMCTVCDKVYNQGLHKYGQYVCTNTHHSQTCACGYENTCEHVIEIIPKVDPTTTSTGLTEGKKCSQCEYIILNQEVIPVVKNKGCMNNTVVFITSINTLFTMLYLTIKKKS